MINPTDLHEKLVKLGNEWAEAKNKADMLTETKKTLLAQLMTNMEGSQAAREMAALATKEYETHILGMVEAQTLEHKAKVKYDAAKAYTELLRTQAATERAANKYAT